MNCGNAQLTFYFLDLSIKLIQLSKISCIQIVNLKLYIT